MDTILETNAAVESVRRAAGGCTAHGDGTSDRPPPEWARGTCPVCGQELVSICYYVPSRGYPILHECRASLGPAPTCGYRKVL